MNVALFQKRQDKRMGRSPVAGAFARRKLQVGVFIVVQCQANLFQIIAALHAASRFPRLLHGR